MSSPLDILWEDPHLLALVKPGGQFPLGTWAPEGQTTLEADVRAYLAPECPQSAYVGVVHRLDRATSGVLVWAKHPKAARRLSRQFQARTVQKEYWALVESCALTPQALVQSTWKDWLTDAHRHGVARVVPEGTLGAREAVTELDLRLVKRVAGEILWIRLYPQTGRTHQLRAQAAARGWPILGDLAYGSTRDFVPPGAIALHARTLQIQHPMSGERLRFVAPAPLPWLELGVQDAEV